MSSINDGGPAFPIPAASPEHCDVPGMSLRDWFAGQAMIGILRFDSTAIDISHANRDRAKDAYRIADAMLAARTTTQGGE